MICECQVFVADFGRNNVFQCWFLSVGFEHFSQISSSLFHFIYQTDHRKRKQQESALFPAWCQHSYAAIVCVFSVHIVSVSPLKEVSQIVCNVCYLYFQTSMKQSQRQAPGFKSTENSGPALSLKNRRQRRALRLGQDSMIVSAQRWGGQSGAKGEHPPTKTFWRATNNLLKIMIFLQPDSVFQLKTAGIVHFFVS